MKDLSDEAEAELNASYRGMISRLSTPDTVQIPYTKIRETLRLAQRSWVAYREADCQALSLIHEEGHGRDMAYLGCMTKRARARTIELGAFWQE